MSFPITIRPYRLQDIPALYTAVVASRDELSRWLPWCHPDYSMEDTTGWVREQLEAFPAGREYAFAVFDSAGSLVGGCGLNRVMPHDGVANLGYWVHSAYRRRGIAVQATRMLVDWAFAHTELVRLEVVVSVHNIASQRTATKAGAVREGLLRSRIMLEGTPHDAVIYSFIRRDLESGAVTLDVRSR